MDGLNPAGFHAIGVGALMLLLGAAMLAFKWQPPSIPLHPPADPDRARVAEARVVMVLAVLVMALGVGQLLLTDARLQALMPYWAAVFGVATVAGLVHAFRAARPAPGHNDSPKKRKSS